MWVRILLLLTSLAVLTVAGNAAPIQTSPQKPSARPGGPPFSVSGFSYELIKGEIHVFNCTSAGCGGPGSKVSYILYRTPRKTFQQYKAERAAVEKGLRANTPANVTMKVTPPKQTKDKLFTIFESRVVYTNPEKRKHVTLSRTIQTKSMNVDLISSGGDEKQVEANSAASCSAPWDFLRSFRSDRRDKGEAKPPPRSPRS